MSDLALYRPTNPQDDPERYGRTIEAEAEYPRDLDELHDELVRWFEESEMARQDEITLAQRDRDYVDGAQWTKEELAELKKRGQPAIVINNVGRMTTEHTISATLRA